MKNKIFSLFALSALALMLFTGLASADINFLDSNNNTITSLAATVQQGNSVTISFKAQEFGTSPLDLTGITFNAPITMTMASGSNTFASASTVTGAITSLAQDATSGLMTLTFNVPLLQATGTYTGNLTLSGTYASAVNYNLPITLTVTDNTALPFCNVGTGAVNASNLDLKVKISNSGEDDLTWNPLDTVRVEVTFKNDNPDEDEDDLNDVTLKLGLLDSAGNDVAEDLQWISDEENEVELGDVDVDEKVTHVFEFKIDTSEVNPDDYKLVVKAYADENEACIDFSDDFDASDYFEEVSIEGETDKDKMVVVDVDALSQPIEVQCGQKVSLTLDVWNIAEDTDFQDKVKVTLYNQALGLNMENVINGDFDAGDQAKVTFTFDVPKNAEEKTQVLQLRTYYDYDEDDDAYDRESDETFDVILKVAGSCVYATADTTDVTAELVSGGKAGQPLVIMATVENTGDKEVSYTFSLEGYSSWAELEEITPVTVTLAPGESEEVSITLNVDKDAKGEKTFEFETYSNGQLVTKQPLSAEITGGFSLSSITGGVVSGESAPLIIGLVSVILVVLIIIIIVKVAKK